MTSDARGRLRTWATVALAAYGAAIAGVLLLPVLYGGFVNSVTRWVQGSLGLTMVRSGWVEFGANILMFVPLGLLVTLLARKPWHGVALALLLSVVAELAQILVPSRQPSLRDVLANVAGGAVGAALAWLVLRRSRRRSRGRNRRS